MRDAELRIPHPACMVSSLGVAITLRDAGCGAPYGSDDCGMRVAELRIPLGQFTWCARVE